MDDSNTASSFRFHGSWREFARIAVPNLLLTIVTLGIYRFWATTRERQYLWGKTDFIDERLEWTGTGLELFIGFIMAVVLILVPFFGIQFLTQALVLQGYTGWAAVMTFVMFGFIMYMIGIARFRALRYRLSRTYWHGIRGGSDDQGFGYGWSYIWKTFVGYLALGLLVPWSMMNLWNERWNKMSFGPHKIDAVGNYADFGLCRLAHCSDGRLSGVVCHADFHSYDGFFGKRSHCTSRQRPGGERDIVAKSSHIHFVTGIDARTRNRNEIRPAIQRRRC